MPTLIRHSYFQEKKQNPLGEITVIDASNANLDDKRLDQPIRSFETSQASWLENPEFRFGVHSNKVEVAIFRKMQVHSTTLGQITELSQGLIPYNTKEMSAQNPYISPRQGGKDWKPFLDKGTCISRYSLEWNGYYVKYGKWLYTANQPKFYENNKILIQRHRNPSLQRRIVATFDTERFYFKDNLCCVIPAKTDYALHYILGILNSTMMNLYYKRNFTEVSLNPIYLRQLPIRTINFADAADKARHDRMVTLVEQMLDLHKRLHAAKTETDRELYQRQIDATDKQIDALVYTLYDLSAEEIAIVEGK